ncbi:MAG: hypothetical protein ACLRZ9_10785 [Eubacterium sp.]
MKTGILAIYDLEPDYANGLMEYISDKQGIPFKTVAFTEKSALLEYVSQQYVDILLISASAMEDSLGQKDFGKIILLSSGNIFSEYIGYDSIYKYQSTENIVREVLDYYADIHKDNGMISIAKGNTEIIGVYSPLGRTGQTTFALTLGQVLASDYTSLYINMEEFSAFDKIFEKNYPGDLSDLMYFFKQNPESLPIKLQAVVNNIHGLDYVPPLLYSADLRDINTEEWVHLIQKIVSTGNYEKIVLDLGSMVKDVFQILNMCSTIYMPISDDRISLMKISAYEEYLLKSEREDLLKQMVKVKIPQANSESWSENYMEQQLWGALGDFVRKILREAA